MELTFSKQIVVTLAVELLLLIITLFLLTEPGFVVKPRGPGFRNAMRAGGLLFLCITFCWSFILGCILAIQRISFRI